jgi:hypothetical protein
MDSMSRARMYGEACLSNNPNFVFAYDAAVNHIALRKVIGVCGLLEGQTSCLEQQLTAVNPSHGITAGNETTWTDGTAKYTEYEAALLFTLIK